MTIKELKDNAEMTIGILNYPGCQLPFGKAPNAEI